MVFSSYIFLKKTDISATCRWETNSKAKCSPQHPDCRDRLPKLVASHPVHLDHSLLTFSSPVPFCCYLHNDDENSCRLPCVCVILSHALLRQWEIGFGLRIRTGRGPLILEEDRARAPPAMPHWLIASCMQTKDLSLPTATALLHSSQFLVSFFHCVSTLLSSDSPACAKPSR